LRAVLVPSFALIAFSCINPVPIQAENSIKIESKWVETGASDVVLGIHLENEMSIGGVLVVLEIRSIHVGSFIRRSLGIVPQNRLLAWAGDQPFTVKNFYPYRTISPYGNKCPVDSQGRVWAWMASDSLPDFIGEEALLYYFTSMGPDNLSAGSDGEQNQGTASLELIFDVTEEGGAFEIDTTCAAASNHTSFFSFDIWNPEPRIVAPSFRKGIVLIGCNSECHGDPVCDGRCDMIDLVKSVDVAFNGAAPVIDPDPRCPVENTDVNCDLVTDVLDIVRMINVQYRAASQRNEFCVPCNHIPRTGNPREDVKTPYFRSNGT
jgi:hypothetical protein